MKEIIEILEETAPLSPAHRHIFKVITGRDIPAGCKSLEEYLQFKKDVPSQRNAGQKKQEPAPSRWTMNLAAVEYLDRILRPTRGGKSYKPCHYNRELITRYPDISERVFAEYVCGVVDNYVQVELPYLWQETQIATYDATHQQCTSGNPCSVSDAMMLRDLDYGSVSERFLENYLEIETDHRVAKISMKDIAGLLKAIDRAELGVEVKILHSMAVLYGASCLLDFAKGEAIEVEYPATRKDFLLALEHNVLPYLDMLFEGTIPSREPSTAPLFHILQALSSQISKAYNIDVRWTTQKPYLHIYL